MKKKIISIDIQILRKIPLKIRLILSYAIIAALMIAVSVIDLVATIRLTNDAAYTFHTVIMPTIHMTRFAIPYGQVRASIRGIGQSTADEDNEAHKKAIEDGLEVINAEIGAYMEILRQSSRVSGHTEKEAEAVRLMVTTLDQYTAICLGRLIPAGMRNDNDEVNRIVAEDLKEPGIVLRAQIDILTNIQEQKISHSRDFTETAMFERNHRIAISFGIVLSSLFLMMFFSFIIIKSIMVPVWKIAQDAEEIAKGNTNVRFETGFTDEIGVLSKHFGNVTGMLNNVIASLNKHGSYAAALNQAATIFVSRIYNTFESTMTNGIRKIADAAGLDRVGIYRNFYGPGGLHAGQIYRWDKKSGGTTDIAAGVANFLYRKFDPGLEELLSCGGYLNGPIGSHPQLDRKWLNMFGVRSMLALPIMIQNKFWGVVTFQDHHNDRYFDDVCVEMLRSAAVMCSSSIIQYEMERQLVESEERIHSIMDAAPLGVLILDKNIQVISVNDYLLKLHGFDSRQEYNEYFLELMPEYQPDGSKSVETAIMYINRVLNGETLVLEWMRMTLAGEYIPMEVTLSPTYVNSETAVLIYMYDLRGAKKAARALSESEARNRIMMATSPTGCVMIDGNCNPFDCNAVTSQLFGLADKRYYLEHFYELSPERQPDGSLSAERARSLMKRALAGETLKFDWMHCSPSGEPLPMEITLTRVMYDGEYVVLGHYYDMRGVGERK